MANEAVLLVQYSPPVNMTVADGTGIEKGALLKLTDPNTAIAQSAANDAVAGVAAAEKIASDGVTKLAVHRSGIFKVTLSGSCTVGDALIYDASANHVSVPNKVNSTDPDSVSGSNIFGVALETGTTGETIRAELRPQTVRNS